MDALFPTRLTSRLLILLTLGILLIAPFTGPLVAVLSGATVIVVAATTIKSPMVGVFCWALALAFVPDRTPLLAGTRPATFIGLGLVVGLIAAPGAGRFRFRGVDVLFLAGLASVIGLVVFGDHPPALLSQMVGMVGLAYTAGRLAPQGADRALVGTAFLVAIVGVAEFVLEFNLWEHWFPAYGHMQGVQARAGVYRAEASFAHAIAFGAFLVLALPFTERLARHKRLVQVVIVCGILASVSRAPIVALPAVILMMAMRPGHSKHRFRMLLAALLLAAVVYVVFGLIYGADDAMDLAGSSNARNRQWEETFPHVRLFGTERIAMIDGQTITAGSRIIDNTFLRLSINFGLLVAILLLSPIVACLVSFVKAKSSAAVIAVLGQLPILAVTSLIAQWQVFLFFAIGLAVTEVSVGRQDSDGRSGGLGGRYAGRTRRPIGVRRGARGT